MSSSSSSSHTEHAKALEPRNIAFVFVKPHANTNEVRNLVRATFGNVGIEITREGELTAAEIDSKKLIDQHYYAIASKATILKPAQLNVPVEQFEKAFGISWQKAQAEARVFNAADACAELGIESDELDKRWADAKKAGKLIKFGGGFYCGELPRDNKLSIFVFNGFFMSMRQKYVAKGTSIYFFVVSFDPAKLSWQNFRSKVLGATDPNDAVPGSLRNEILKKWQALGLKAAPNVGDNGVHASASPFEGLAERMNWLGVKPADDAFGKLLIAAGMSAKTIEAWSLDPQVTYGPTAIKGSLFDALEDTDADECLAKAQLISLGPHFKPHDWTHTMVCGTGGIAIGVALGVAASKVFKL